MDRVKQTELVSRSQNRIEMSLPTESEIQEEIFRLHMLWHFNGKTPYGCLVCVAYVQWCCFTKLRGAIKVKCQWQYMAKSDDWMKILSIYIYTDLSRTKCHLVKSDFRQRTNSNSKHIRLLVEKQSESQTTKRKIKFCFFFFEFLFF